MHAINTSVISLLKTSDKYGPIRLTVKAFKLLPCIAVTYRIIGGDISLKDGWP